MKAAFIPAAAAAVLFAVLAGCRSETPTAQDTPPAPPPPGKTLQVYVFNYPMEFLAKRMAGETAEVHYPVPADADPEYWEPTSEQLEKIQQADLILLSGANFEKWVEHHSLPEGKVINTTERMTDEYIKLPDAVVHKHGPEGEEHSHEGLATYTWLDPDFIDAQTHIVRDSMAKLRPDAQGVYFGNWTGFAPPLSSLKARYRNLAAATPDLQVIGSHPVYNYLAEHLGWSLRSVHWEAGETPSDEQWAEFAALHQEHPAKIMLWEAEPTEETRKRLQDEFGITSIVFDTLVHKPESGDYMSAIQDNLAQLETALGVEPPQQGQAPQAPPAPGAGI